MFVLLVLWFKASAGVTLVGAVSLIIAGLTFVLLGWTNNWIRIVYTKSARILQLLEMIHFPRRMNELIRNVLELRTP
jgi:hypothetical protein